MSDQHFRSIQTILVGVHHLWELSLEGNAHANIGIDTRCHTMTTFGGNQDNTIRTPCTVDGSGILENLYLLDVVGIDVEQQIRIVANMKRVARFLHVVNHTVDNDQWLSIGIQGVQTTNKHGTSITRTARASDGVDVCTQLAFDFRLYTL